MQQKNVVVTNPTVAPVKLASSVLEDHGVAVEDTENLAVLYQYPIGIGSDEEQNFDGKQKQQDVIGKMTVETQWEETQLENDTASGAAVSGGAVLDAGNSSVSGAGVGVATEGAVVAETE